MRSASSLRNPIICFLSSTYETQAYTSESSRSTQFTIRAAPSCVNLCIPKSTSTSDYLQRHVHVPMRSWKFPALASRGDEYEHAACFCSCTPRGYPAFAYCCVKANYRREITAYLSGANSERAGLCVGDRLDRAKRCSSRSPCTASVRMHWGCFS